MGGALENINNAIKLLSRNGYEVKKIPSKKTINRVSLFGRHNYCSLLNVWQFTTTKEIPKESYPKIEKLIQKAINDKSIIYAKAKTTKESR